MEPYLALVSPPHILTQSPALSHHQLHLTDPDFHKFIIYIFILFIMFINIFFLYLYIDTISGPLPPSQLQPTDPFLAVQDSSIGDLVTHSLINSLTF